MRPIQPPSANRPRRRPDLTLPCHNGNLKSHSPFPLPPSSAPPTSTSQLQSNSKQQQQSFNLSELDRLNRIGSGSGGTVYKVLHRPTGRLFALKVIYGNHENDVRRQICREIEILRDVDNLNIVKCHDMYDHGGEIQVLLEYMDGGSLEGTHISNEASLADLTRQVLAGIYYLHRRKIVIVILSLPIWRFPFAVGRQGDWASLMCAICMSQPPEAPPTASREFRGVCVVLSAKRSGQEVDGGAAVAASVRF
ncbi:hypothetical protein OSB04_030382 [Centaurea solstitialis]|uniref:Protein kinase domain-containing protein n=1 Tax=Centaurea solstitialis TaxID=347529 RepID=A0AA38W4X4_9ASTR|nr:hypothetical protein OSB04_030382 [Centaurea solstitialis]